jgi:hypothetical protein
MSLPAFLSALLEHGRVVVPPPDQSAPAEGGPEVRAVLSDRARAVALSFPGQPPDCDPNISAWGARQLYRASQLAVYRHLDSESVMQLLAEPCPPGPPAVRHWSVDLTFVFLPDLMLLARSASESDPLLVHLRQWAADWPLSSIGVKGICPRNVAEIAAHPGLLQLYVDRMLAKKDWSRLESEPVKEAVRQSLGVHVSQWPELTETLKSDQPLRSQSKNDRFIE